MKFKKMSNLFCLFFVLISMLDHPCLVKTFGAGIKDNKNPFLVTELVHKGALFDLLHNSAIEIDNNTKLTWALDVANGMAYLHSMGVIHRDLKSLNLLVCFL
jgi:serine/threonine protein kinase